MGVLNTNYYEKYVGCYAKRFYTSFEYKNYAKIIGFQLKYEELMNDNFAYFTVEADGDQWDWDVEDCVIITNDFGLIEDERVANVNNPRYHGDNPYKTK